MSIFALTPNRLLARNTTEEKGKTHTRTLPEIGIGVGDFILLAPFDTDEQVLGRVVETVHSLHQIPDAEQETHFDENSSYFLVHIWPFVDSSGSDEIVNLSSNDNLAAVNIREVMEGDAGCWISSNDQINDVAFVVRLNNISSDKYGCLNGIKNIFFVRYTLLSGTPVILPNFSQFVDNQISPSYRAFNSTLHMIKEFGKIMFRASQSQSNTVYARGINIFPDYWRYMIRKVRQSCNSIIINEQRRKLCKSRWRQNLMMKKIRIRTVVHTLTAETTDGINCLATIFGDAFYKGVR